MISDVLDYLLAFDFEAHHRMCLAFIVARFFFIR